MIELLLVPAAGLTVALFGDKFQRKDNDKRKIQVFFEVSRIAIKREEKISYIIQSFKSKSMMIVVQHLFIPYPSECRVKLFKRLRML